MEAGVLVGFGGEPIFWHVPPNRTVASLPDSRELWDVLWENRASVYGFAHSHPGSGLTGPSWEDITTFAGIELALGRRLVWWITTTDRLVTVLWAGPGKYDYITYPDITVPTPQPPVWLAQLREFSTP